MIVPAISSRYFAVAAIIARPEFLMLEGAGPSAQSIFQSPWRQRKPSGTIYRVSLSASPVSKTVAPRDGCIWPIDRNLRYPRAPAPDTASRRNWARARSGGYGSRLGARRDFPSQLRRSFLDYGIEIGTDFSNVLFERRRRHRSCFLWFIGSSLFRGLLLL